MDSLAKTNSLSVLISVCVPVYWQNLPNKVPERKVWKFKTSQRTIRFWLFYFSTEANYGALFSDYTPTYTIKLLARNSEYTTGHYGLWSMSFSLRLRGTFPLRAPTLWVWEGIPQWASEWLASAIVISESFPTCSISDRPRPLQPGLLFINWSDEKS